MDLKTWFMETRPHFLLLSVILVFLGTSTALYEGSFHLSDFILTLVGLILLHVSVNVLNDYFDYRSGIDLEVKRTPFSGGSGVLPARLLKPSSVYRFGLLCFLLATPIGIYFLSVKGVLLLPLLLMGVVSVLFYTTHLARWMVGELFAGLGLGTLPVLGIYFIQSGAYALPALIASIPPGILTHNLLLLNELPDVGPDTRAGRRNWSITLGRGGASKIYSILTSTVYLWILGGVATQMMPVSCILGLLTTPFALKAVKGALRYRDGDEPVPMLAANVIVVLGTQALMATGYLIASFL